MAGSVEKRIIRYFEMRFVYNTMTGGLKEIQNAWKQTSEGIKQAVTGSNAEVEKMREGLRTSVDSQNEKLTTLQEQYHQIQVRLQEVIKENILATGSTMTYREAIAALIAEQEKLLALTSGGFGYQGAAGAAIEEELAAKQASIEALREHAAALGIDTEAEAANAEAANVTAAALERMVTAEAETAAAVDAATAALEAETAALAKADSAATTFATVMAGAGKAITGVIGFLTTILTKLAGVVAVAGLAIDQLGKSTAKYATEVLALNNETGISTDRLQTYIAMGKQYNVTQEMVTTQTRMLARELARMTDAQLEAVGATDAQGRATRDADTALKGLENTMNNTTIRSNKVAAASKLFGRTGQDLIPIVSEGSATLDKQQEALTRLGVVMDQDQLKNAAFGESLHNELSMQMEGAAHTIGATLMPQLSMFWALLSSLVANSKGLIVSLAEAVMGAIIWVFKFLNALTGQAMPDLNQILDDAKTLFVANTNSANGLAKAATNVNQAGAGAKDSLKGMKLALDELTQSTQLQTKAIDDQIKTIQDNETEYEAALNNRLRSMNDALTMNDLLQKQADEMHTSLMSQLQDEIDLLHDAGDSTRRSGENVIQYRRRLLEQQLNDQMKTEKNSLDLTKTNAQLAIEQQREANQAAIDASKLVTDTEIANLNTRKDALNAYLKAATDAYQQASAAQAAASNAALGGVLGNDAAAVADAGLSSADITAMFAKMHQQINSDTASSADFVGRHLHRLFTDPGGELQADATWLGTQLATLIWNQFPGMVQSLYDMFSTFFDWVDKALQGVQWLAGQKVPGTDGKQTVGGDLKGALLSGLGLSWINNANAEGGIFTQPSVGMYGEDGAEAIVPLTKPTQRDNILRQAGLPVPGQGGGGTTFNTVFSGPVADQLVASRVMDRYATEARRRGLVLAGGTGF